MTEVVSFNDYLPSARYDGNPWTEAQIDEAETFDGPWTTIDTITFDVPDPDPANPGERSFTTPNGTAPDLWYRVIFLDDAAGQSMPTTPVQNTGSQSAPYATADDLFRVLKVRAPSADQVVAAQGDLDTATLEINAYIDWSDDHAPATPEQLELFRGVCIDRAADLWRHRESAPGILGIGDESAVSVPGRYSWSRYAARLSVACERFGVA